MSVEVLHDLGPRAAIGLLERRDGIELLRCRVEQLVREAVKLVFDRLSRWSRVRDGRFAGMTLALVQNELSLRLSVTLGIQLRHRAEECVQLKRAPASGRRGFGSAGRVFDIRREQPQALVSRGDLMAVGFARGARVGCDRAADGA